MVDNNPYDKLWQLKDAAKKIADDLGLELSHWHYNCIEDENGHRVNSISAAFGINPDTFKSASELESDALASQFDAIVAEGYSDQEEDPIRARWDAHIAELKKSAEEKAREWGDDDGD